MLETLLPSLFDLVRIGTVMEHVARVAALDRFQASLGLEAAADLVAAAAEAAGLSEVTLERFPADGGDHWWTFRAPVSWTPTTGRLHLPATNGAPSTTVDHATQPFALATYSAATAAGGVRAPLVPVRSADEAACVPAGALALVAPAVAGHGTLIPNLTAAGALGLLTDVSRRDDLAAPTSGRIELPPDSRLLAFSLTPGQYAAAEAAAACGALAEVEVTVDRTAAMPVVSGLLPGTDPTAGEVWLIAHLCHPRPGANDNASGVAALLGAAETLVALEHTGRGDTRRRGIRFFWGPEFVGTAAVLHRRLGPGAAPGAAIRPPHALINLDMVGEDQTRCHSPFLVERPPDTVPSLLAPLAEHVVDAVFRATCDQPGRWSTTPFQGFSDHALLADPGFARPAVHFCHPADRFNHSGADSLDKVSPVEMLRSTVAGAALAQLLAQDRLPTAALCAVVDDWCLREERAAAEVVQDLAGPWGDAWVQSHLAHVRHTNTRMRALAATGEVAPSAPARCGDVASAEPSDHPQFPGPPGPRPLAAWGGPLNLRAMLGALSPATRARLTTLVAEDKNWLSVLFNLAIRADGRRTREQIIEETGHGLRRSLPQPVAEELLDALVASGWLTESGAAAPRTADPNDMQPDDVKGGAR
jgi:hypothetical protein